MTEELQAGRQLDFEIALKVFGIKKVYYQEHDRKQEWPEYIPSGKPWRTHQIDARPIPHFSTEPSAAYLLKLEVAKRGFWWEIHSPFFRSQPWFAGLTPHNTTGWNGEPDFKAQGKTEMEAVCRVALLLLQSTK